MEQNCPSDLIDYLVSKFFCNELEAVKVKCYYFDGSVTTNIVSRDMLEEIRLNCDYPSSEEEENDSGDPQ